MLLLHYFVVYVIHKWCQIRCSFVIQTLKGFSVQHPHYMCWISPPANPRTLPLQNNSHHCLGISVTQLKRLIDRRAFRAVPGRHWDCTAGLPIQAVTKAKQRRSCRVMAGQHDHCAEAFRLCLSGYRRIIGISTVKCEGPAKLNGPHNWRRCSSSHQHTMYITRTTA